LALFRRDVSDADAFIQILIVFHNYKQKTTSIKSPVKKAINAPFYGDDMETLLRSYKTSINHSGRIGLGVSIGAGTRPFGPSRRD
jgi:hypothetical protein